MRIRVFAILIIIVMILTVILTYYSCRKFKREYLYCAIIGWIAIIILNIYYQYKFKKFHLTDRRVIGKFNNIMII